MIYTIHTNVSNNDSGLQNEQREQVVNLGQWTCRLLKNINFKHFNYGFFVTEDALGYVECSMIQHLKRILMYILEIFFENRFSLNCTFFQILAFCDDPPILVKYLLCYTLQK